MLMFQHYILRKIVAASLCCTSPLQRDTRQTKTGLP